MKTYQTIKEEKSELQVNLFHLGFTENELNLICDIYNGIIINDEKNSLEQMSDSLIECSEYGYFIKWDIIESTLLEKLSTENVPLLIKYIELFWWSPADN